MVRFRSGRKIHFTLNCGSNPQHHSLFYRHFLDSFFYKLQRRFLETCVQKPACHRQVLGFLHQKQTALTGRSALTDLQFRNMLNMLLSPDQSQRHPKDINGRLRDLVVIMEKTLTNAASYTHCQPGCATKLNFLLNSGNPRVNLFHPLVVSERRHQNDQALGRSP